jgi:hypothetical protein
MMPWTDIHDYVPGEMHTLCTENGLRYYSVFSVEVDGVFSSRVTSGLYKRPMFQVLSTDISKTPYCPTSYDEGDICEVCWLVLGHVWGEKSCQCGRFPNLDETSESAEL